MVKDKKKLEEIEATKKILIRIFLILLLIFSFNFIPQFLLNNIAKYFIKHNNYSYAEKCYKAILVYEYRIYKNVNHTNPDWLNKLAEVYIQDKKYDLALLCYQQSISIYNSRAHVKIYANKIIDYLINIGDIYLLKNQSNNALEVYKNALSLCENYYEKNSSKTINITKKINRLTAKNKK